MDLVKEGTPEYQGLMRAREVPRIIDAIQGVASSEKNVSPDTVAMPPQVYEAFQKADIQSAYESFRRGEADGLIRWLKYTVPTRMFQNAAKNRGRNGWA